jgi:hypothetical protein
LPYIIDRVSIFEYGERENRKKEKEAMPPPGF